jgi:hypothetical protein
MKLNTEYKVVIGRSSAHLFMQRSNEDGQDIERYTGESYPFAAYGNHFIENMATQLIEDGWIPLGAPEFVPNEHQPLLRQAFCRSIK